MPTSALPRGKTINVLFKDEADFGISPSGNWTATSIYSHSLEQAEPFEKDSLLGLPRNNNRDSTSPAPSLAQVAGNIVAPVDYNHIGWLLKGAFGAASVSGAGDPYTHTFVSGGEVLPHRAMQVQLGASIFMVYNGLLVSKLSFDISRKANYDRITAEIMGQKETKYASTQGGTPATAWAAAPAPASLPIFKLNGTQLGFVTAMKGTYDNKAVAQNYLSGTKYISGHDLDDEATYDGTLDIRFTDTTLYEMAVANAAPFTGETLWNTSASRSLSILANAMRFERKGIPVPGPGGITQTFKYWSEQSASTPMLTVTLKSLVSAY